MDRDRVVRLCKCAVMTVVISVCAMVSFPLPFTPVPLSLSTFSVMLSGLLLGPGGGTAATGCYLLLGAVGLPVFSGMQGGLGVFAGPTGGFLVGYLILAFGCGFFSRLFQKKCPAVLATVLSIVVSNVAFYAIGTAWYAVYADVGLPVALAVTVLPFLLGDAIKIAVATGVSARFSKIVKKMGHSVN